MRVYIMKKKVKIILLAVASLIGLAAFIIFFVYSSLYVSYQITSKAPFTESTLNDPLRMLSVRDRAEKVGAQLLRAHFGSIVNDSKFYEQGLVPEFSITAIDDLMAAKHEVKNFDIKRVSENVYNVECSYKIMLAFYDENGKIATDNGKELKFENYFQVLMMMTAVWDKNESKTSYRFEKVEIKLLE